MENETLEEEARQRALKGDGLDFLGGADDVVAELLVDDAPPDLVTDERGHLVDDLLGLDLLGLVASLLALLTELRQENENKDKIIDEWENGKRTKREEVWGYDG